MHKSERSSHCLGLPSTPIAGPTSRVTDGIFHTSLDRRHFLSGSAFALLGAQSLAFAQETKQSAKPSSDVSKVKAAPSSRATKKLSQVIAEFINGFDLKNVPSLSMDLARVVFIDTVGVMLAGSREPVSDIVCDMVKMEGTAPTASIVGRSWRASPQLAAFANGVAAAAMDYDFSYMSAQSVSPVIPAILPIAETVGASPAESIAAFIIGCEVASRIVRTNPTISSVGGWHSNSVVGTIAAAAACAKLLKTPAAAIPNVIGISASMASGLSDNFGTMTKPLHSGHAARNGIVAALLGTRGLTASASSLEGRTGYFDNFAKGLELSFDPFNDLGRRYDLGQGKYALKLYPCGGLSHASIDAALELRVKLGNRLSDITSIKVGVTKQAGRRLGDQYPSNVDNAKFSIPYLIAYTLVHGAPMLSAFTEEALHDDRVKLLAKTVSSSIDQEFADLLEVTPSRVRIYLSDGQTVEQMRYYYSGMPQAPLSQTQIEDKFYACASKAVSDNAARKLFVMLNTLSDRPSFNDFWPLVRS